MFCIHWFQIDFFFFFFNLAVCMQAVTVRKWCDQYIRNVLREMRDKERDELGIFKKGLVRYASSNKEYDWVYPKNNERKFLGYLQGIWVHLQFDAALCTWRVGFKDFTFWYLLVYFLRLLNNIYFGCLLLDTN